MRTINNIYKVKLSARTKSFLKHYLFMKICAKCKARLLQDYRKKNVEVRRPHDDVSHQNYFLSVLYII